MRKELKNKLNFFLTEYGQLSLQEYFFLTFLILLTVSKAWGLSSGNIEYKILSLIAVSQAMLAVLLGKYRYWDILKAVGILLLGVIGYMHSKQPTFLMLFFALASSKGVDISKCLKWTGIAWCITFGINTALAMLGVTECSWLVDPNGPGELVIRYGFGIGNQNIFHACFFIAITYYLYNTKKHNKPFIAVLLILNYFFYRLTHSTTGFLMSCVSVILFLLAEWICERKNRRLTYLVSIVGSIGCAFPILISFGSAYFFDWNGKISNFIYKISNGRNLWLRQYMERYDITLLGQQFDARSGGVVLDNAYGTILYRHGALMLFVFIILYFFIIKDFACKRNLKGIILCLLFLTYGISEQFMQNCIMNFSMLYMSQVFWNRELCLETQSKSSDLIVLKLKNIMVSVASKWKLIILISLCVGICGGIFGYVHYDEISSDIAKNRVMTADEKAEIDQYLSENKNNYDTNYVYYNFSILQRKYFLDMTSNKGTIKILFQYPYSIGWIIYRYVIRFVLIAFLSCCLGLFKWNTTKEIYCNYKQKKLEKR